MLRPVAGKLFVVATPLGNLEDLSPRALDTLRQVSCIACEDTRRTAKLLARYAVKKPLVSCHRFNERRQSARLLARLRAGEDVALVADSGTPAVSDPGSWLVRAALDEGLAVSPLPGPSAVAALLSASGLPADRYVFDGFLPHRKGERRRRLRQLRDEPRTLVLFETPHRLHDTLRDIDEIMGARPVVLGRELTKLHESILRGTAHELLASLGPGVRGEITLVLAGAEGRAVSRAEDAPAEGLRAQWRAYLEQSDGDRRAALRLASRELGLKRADLFRRLLDLGEEGS
jgi:16S rRNA (cytidine1402-2'-O)-methyltransferase